MTRRMPPAGTRNASLRVPEAARGIAAREGAGKTAINAVARNVILSQGEDQNLIHSDICGDRIGPADVRSAPG